MLNRVKRKWVRVERRDAAPIEPHFNDKLLIQHDPTLITLSPISVPDIPPTVGLITSAVSHSAVVQTERHLMIVTPGIDQ